MKYVNQKDYPHWLYVTKTDLEEPLCTKGKTTTVASSACGLCSAVMVADRLLVNSNFELKDAIDLAYATKANYSNGTSYQRFAPAFAEKLGFEWEGTNDPERLRYCLRTGGAAVIHIGGDREGHIGVFSDSGHYVVVAEADGDEIGVLDPMYRPGRFDIPGRKGKVRMEGNVAYADWRILRDDCFERPFFLFSKKEG